MTPAGAVPLISGVLSFAGESGSVSVSVGEPGVTVIAPAARPDDGWFSADTAAALTTCSVWRPAALTSASVVGARSTLKVKRMRQIEPFVGRTTLPVMGLKLTSPVAASISLTANCVPAHAVPASPVAVALIENTPGSAPVSSGHPMKFVLRHDGTSVTPGLPSHGRCRPPGRSWQSPRRGCWRSRRRPRRARRSRRCLRARGTRPRATGLSKRRPPPAARARSTRRGVRARRNGPRSIAEWRGRRACESPSPV